MNEAFIGINFDGDQTVSTTFRYEVVPNQKKQGYTKYMLLASPANTNKTNCCFYHKTGDGQPAFFLKLLQAYTRWITEGNKL